MIFAIILQTLYRQIITAVHNSLLMINNIDDIDWTWIENNRNSDTFKLRLNARNRETTDFAILQIECRRKTAKKLPHTLQNNRFIFPTALSAEQCTSDLLAQFHATFIRPGEKILDMTSGLGIDVFHFAKMASTVTAIDIDPDVSKALAINSKSLNLDNVCTINADSIDYLSNTDDKYDVIFVDPARRGFNGKRLYALCECAPNITEMLSIIKSKCKRFIVKASPMLDITQTLRELPDATDIYTIGTINECKELVIISDFENNTDEATIHAITLIDDTEIRLTYNISSENNASAMYNTPKEDGYLYEPYPSVMKASPTKYLSQLYGVEKLHLNTHLYTSDTIINDFPGEIFKIEQIIPFSSKEIKRFSSIYPQINIATRNFVMSADELRKKLKVKDGGSKRAIGCTTINGSKIIIITTKI